jgi:Holliday junction resolvase-like predicted endonuclease
VVLATILPGSVMHEPHRTGTLAEELVSTYLRLHAIEVLRRNVCCGGVEVDIVARQQSRLILVEVKLRRPGAALVASQALGPRQRLRLRRAATWALERCVWAHSARVDLVGVSWRPGSCTLRVEHLCGVE